MKKDFLVISENRVIHKIPFSEIVHVVSSGMNSFIHKSNGDRHRCSKSMGTICKELNTDIFLRIHTSHTVNHNHISKVKKEINGVVIMSNGSVLPISKRRKKDFFDKYLS